MGRLEGQEEHHTIADDGQVGGIRKTWRPAVLVLCQLRMETTEKSYDQVVDGEREARTTLAKREHRKWGY